MNWPLFAYIALFTLILWTWPGPGTWPDPGKGWRMLRIGEIIRKGDEVWTLVGWRPATVSIGQRVRTVTFRRRVSNPRKTFNVG